MDLLIDTSVLIKWFHSDGESEVGEARLLRDAHVAGQLEAHVIDLALYEVGNVLIRALGWSGERTADQLDDLVTILGSPLTPTASCLRIAAELCGRHGLSYYDSVWAATARQLGIPLVSAHRKLIAASLAESPSAIAARLTAQ